MNKPTSVPLARVLSEPPLPLARRMSQRFNWLFCLLWICVGSTLYAQTPDAAGMQRLYQNLRPRLAQSPMREGLILDSSESSKRTSGDIYAVLNVPLLRLEQVNRDPVRWCEILLLLSNSKNCTVGTVSADDSAPLLMLQIGTKNPQNLASTTPIDFNFLSSKPQAPVLETRLTSGTGPMGTKDDTLRINAIALNADQSFIHLHYSSRSSMAGRFATALYLQTLGRGKVGFSVAPESTGLVGGVRGIIERNAMRYFLGLGCALQFVAVEVPVQRFDQMAACWYDATELYPIQLYEMTRQDYLDMKRIEFLRTAPKR